MPAWLSNLDFEGVDYPSGLVFASMVAICPIWVKILGELQKIKTKIKPTPTHPLIQANGNFSMSNTYIITLQ